MSPALIVFAKVPEPGKVKTRLTPPLAPEEAAALYDAFLRDALDRYAALSAAPGGPAVRLYLGAAERAPADLVPAGVDVFRQRGRGLGERMLRALVETLAAGHPSAVLIGTDHPTLPDAYVSLALDALAEPLTAVLGPSDDGGYYLLGLNEVVPDLFDMAYSHASVFEDTLARVAEAQLSPVVLPAHYDVDDADTLGRLVEEWAAGADIGRRTARALSGLAPRLGGGGAARP